MRSDKDNDQKIDKQEAKQLALKIRLQLQEYDVDFDSDKFLKVIGKDPSVPGVISIVQKLLPDDDVKEGNERKVVNDGPCCDSDEDSDDEEDEMYGECGSTGIDYKILFARSLTYNFCLCRYVLLV